MDRILLKGLSFFGRHGCHQAEKDLGQKFLVDIELECDLSEASRTDSMDDTVDYIALYNYAREVVGGPSVQLLEVLAGRIADFALQDERVESAWVSVRKPHVAVPGPLEFLGVEITRSRNADPDDE